MKKLVSFVTVTLIFAFSLSVCAFATDGASNGIFSGLVDIGVFIRDLFIPDANYFSNQLSSLNDHVNDRFGGVAYLYLMLNDFFNQLGNVPAVALNVNIPNHLFFPGYRGISIDFFTSAKPYISFLRNVLTASTCLLTAIVCYHKLRHFFSGGETG